MAKLIVALFLAIFAGLIVLSRFVPWWLVLIMTVIMVPVSLKILWWFIQSLGLKQAQKFMQAAGRKLRGARVEIHAITEVPPPASRELDDDDEDDNQDIDRPSLPAWFAMVEMTIEPAATARLEAPANDFDDEAFDEWSPWNFTLVPAEIVVKGDYLEALGVADYPVASVADWHRVGEGDSSDSASDDSYGMLPIEGPSRIQVVFGIPEAMSERLRLRFLTEDFTEVHLPQRSSE
ncbi:MAG: hypothetical protein DHS20C16_10290 [Phycisphaerae bacterium]|nr:MAG: hypothetical protein DHS20C16_10290 [Phycisphaerae bacterium]